MSNQSLNTKVNLVLSKQTNIGKADQIHALS